MVDCTTSQEAQNQNPESAAQERFTRFSLLLSIAAVILIIAAPLVAQQQSRIYHDGYTWVEEITGTLPNAREIHIHTDLGSVEVQ